MTAKTKSTFLKSNKMTTFERIKNYLTDQERQKANLACLHEIYNKHQFANASFYYKICPSCGFKIYQKSFKEKIFNLTDERLYLVSEEPVLKRISKEYESIVISPTLLPKIQNDWDILESLIREISKNNLPISSGLKETQNLSLDKLKQLKYTIALLFDLSPSKSFVLQENNDKMSILKNNKLLCSYKIIGYKLVVFSKSNSKIKEYDLEKILKSQENLT